VNPKEAILLGIFSLVKALLALVGVLLLKESNFMEGSPGKK